MSLGILTISRPWQKTTGSAVTVVREQVLGWDEQRGCAIMLFWLNLFQQVSWPDSLA